MTRLLQALPAALLAATASAAPPPVTAVAISPDGHRVAFGVGGHLRVFGTGGERGPVLLVPEGRVTALAYSPDGNWLAVASGEPGKSGLVRLYDTSWFGQPKGNPSPALDGHKDAVYAVAFAPDGRHLATAGYDRVIQLWDIPGQWPNDPKAEIVPKKTLKDHSDTIYGLSFHPSGKLLASASADRTVKVWDPAAGTRLYTLGEPTDWVYAVVWSPDGKHLAAGGVDQNLRLWAADAAGGKLVKGVFAHQKPLLRLGYTKDGRTLFTAGEDKVVKAWDAAKLVEKKVYPAHPDAILDLAVHPSGEWYAAARFDGVGNRFEAADGKPMANQMLPVAGGPPKPKAVSPAAVAPGVQTVTITGEELFHVRQATTDRPEVKAALRVIDAKEVAVEVEVPSGTPAGAVKLVLENEAGKSAPLTLAVDRQKAIPEAGTTDSARAGMEVRPNVTVAGAIDRAGDVDYFRFRGAKLRPIGVQVVAAEYGSKLDPVLVLTDAAGQVLAEGGAVLGYTPTADGDLAVGVRDREYRGGKDFTYRLQLGDVPVITGVFPLGVQRGKTTAVHVSGVNLGPEAGKAVMVTVPADAGPGSKVPVPLPATKEKPLGKAEVVVDEFPAAVVDPANGAEVKVPGTADGILLRPGDAQAVRFAAKKGERLVIETNAQRLGSPVDPVIEVLDAAGKPVPRAVLRATVKIYSTFRDHDSAGPGIRLETWNDLAIDDLLYADGEVMKIVALPKNPDDDCQFYQVGGRRVGFLDTTPVQHAQGVPMYKVEAHPPGSTFPPNGLPTFPLFFRNDDGGPGYGKDARVFFEAPADGVYQVRVADARGAGGPQHAYRLTVRPPRPDFAVSVSPMSPGVWKGGGVPITVTADRKDGYDGPIAVRLEGLPAGFSAPETTIEAGQTTTAFALSAAADAAVPPNTQPRLIARATIGGKEVAREASLGTPKLLDGGDISVTTNLGAVSVGPGGETRLVVEIEREGDFKGRVPVEVRGLPHGVRVLDIGLNGVLLTERDTRREVVIYAEPWVKPAAHPIAVVARSERKGTDHAARSVLLTVGK
ncbi:MAG: WD40 repeat domain-containing protein [Gemmataceae bacterium]|nr:WD40 repeat domain-containing protein [Gemmataceae bacterium]